MPYGDRTGPEGAGPMTGRGLGFWRESLRRGRGLRFLRRPQLGLEDRKEYLNIEEELLEKKLKAVREEKRALEENINK